MGAPKRQRSVSKARNRGGDSAIPIQDAKYVFPIRYLTKQKRRSKLTPPPAIGMESFCAKPSDPADEVSRPYLVEGVPVDLLLNILDRVFARLTGPLKLRFILQPVMAILLGVRDGVSDAKAGRPPFLAALFADPKAHKPHIQTAFRSLLLPLVVATVLDGVAQYLLFGWIRISGAVLAGVMLMGLPYIIARALTNRIVSRRSRRAVSSPSGLETGVGGEPPA